MSALTSPYSPFLIGHSPSSFKISMIFFQGNPSDLSVAVSADSRCRDSTAPPGVGLQQRFRGKLIVGRLTSGQGPMLWFLKTFAKKIGGKNVVFVSKHCWIQEKKWIIKKNAIFAENWWKSQKIVIITSTPGPGTFLLSEPVSLSISDPVLVWEKWSKLLILP
jgi:hypothetical protein